MYRSHYLLRGLLGLLLFAVDHWVEGADLNYGYVLTLGHLVIHMVLVI